MFGINGKNLLLKEGHLKAYLWRQFAARLSGGFVVALHDMPPQRLAEFVDSLWPARPVHLAELVRRRKQGKSSAGLFAITVDDGVGNNVRALSQLLRARSWPATFYLPTRYLDTGELMAFQWWWRLKPLLPRKKVELRSGPVDLSNPRELQKLSSTVEAMWYQGSVDSYLPLTMELANIVFRETGITREGLQAPDAPITWAEVAQLSRDDLFCFESHSVSHTAMSALDEEDLEFEMRYSQDVLQDHTGRPCRHFCYPFGSPASIGTLAPAVARRFYDSAVTMNLGSVERSDLWLLPRVPLYSSNTVLFARMKVFASMFAAESIGHRLDQQGPGESRERIGLLGAFRPITNEKPDSPKAAVRQK